MYIKYFLLDVPRLSWLEEHKSFVFIFTALAIVAIAALVGIFIYRRMNKKKKNG